MKAKEGINQKILTTRILRRGSTDPKISGMYILKQNKYLAKIS